MATAYNPMPLAAKKQLYFNEFGEFYPHRQLG